MKLASKARKAQKSGGVISEKVTTVPPTREDPSRVVTDYFPAKYSMFWHDKKNRVYHELHVTLRGSKVTTIEGICGEPLTQTVRDYGSPDAAKAAIGAIEREKYAANWQRTGSTRTDFFFVGPPEKTAAGRADTTPVPAKIDGYASDGRMVDDVERLLAGAKKLGKKLPAGTRAELVKHARALPKETQKALLGLADACASGKLRQLCWTFTLGARLAADHGPEELAEILGGNKQWLELASTAIEIAHDGGLAHYMACADGVRVYNNEGSFEAVLTPSVDAFMWGLIHRTAVEHGSYDAKAFKAGLKKLGIKRELPLKDFAPRARVLPHQSASGL